jgi:ABC-type oligopeptide transport system ATPase subunit
MVDETKLNIDGAADKYFKRYKPQMQVLESHSPLSKLRSITPYDHYALGKQLEQFEVYKELCEDNGTAAQLGKLPDLAFDIITVNYGTSPISALASVQPLDEEQGTIYYKNVFAVSKRGSVDPTAGPEMIVGATQMENRELMGYAGDTLTQAVAGGTVDADLTYTTTVGYGPIKPGTVIVTVPALNLTAVDNMQGKLVGYNLQGLINYVTGVVDIQFIQNPGAGHAINVTYATDFEMTDTLPQIQFKLDTKSVRAKVYALKDTVGLEQSYALRRRFGLDGVTLQ